MKSKYIILLLAAVCILFIITTIQYRESSFLRQRILDNEFKLGAYAAIMTMHEQGKLCAGAVISYRQLAQLSIEKQDSLRTILPEGMR